MESKTNDPVIHGDERPRYEAPVIMPLGRMGAAAGKRPTLPGRWPRPLGEESCEPAGSGADGCGTGTGPIVFCFTGQGDA